MSLALGVRLISRPATTSDLLFPPQPQNTTNSSTLSSPAQIYRPGNTHRGGTTARQEADPINSSFGLSLCLHAFHSSKTPGSCGKMMKRFCRMYFGKQSFAAAAGGAGSGHPAEESDLQLNGDGGSCGGDGGGGGKEGSGGSFDGGDLKLEAFSLWWWWQRQSQPETGKKRFEIYMPIETGWRPEKKFSERGKNSNKGEERRRWWRRLLGNLKKALGKIPETLLEAILLPFVWTAILISEPASRRFYRQCFRPFVPYPIAFIQYFNKSFDYVMTVTLLLMSGTSLLLLALLWWWAWRCHLGGDTDSAGDDSVVGQHSQDDYDGDED
ncbi:unnamed protein product [Linum trigynum]|uniref:Uncharacterized protein n=1 Tax=Linum trigynum TaxID=586398 RepID=A0AAV2FI60_9ROSI